MAIRIAIAVMALFVLVCLALPMSDGDPAMAAGLMCCFVLAVLLGAFVLGWPQRTIDVLSAPGDAPSVPRGVVATARGPDPITLGSLLS